MKSILTHALMIGLTALATSAAAAELTPKQVEAAGRVFVGDTECEFKQTVHLAPIADKPGHFELTFKKLRVTVVPEETTTGAVRLEDRESGIVWIQIPAKSMLLNSKLGQRIVDGCVSASQRADAAAAPSNSFGLATPASR